MSRIQSSVGLITGVPIEETVNKLMELNSFPRQQLEGRNTLLKNEQTAVTELLTLVIGVQLTTDRLGQKSLYSATKVTSSVPTALVATSNGSPKVGNYSFVPHQMAQSQQLTSSLFPSGDQNLDTGNLVIHTGGFLDESVNLDTLNGGAGVSRGFISITDRSGATQKVDLRFAQTASDVVDAINSTDSLNVVASLRGGSFVLTDVSGGSSSNLQVKEVSGGTTAADLGLANISTSNTTISGTSVLTLSRSTALRELLDGRGIVLPGSGNPLKFETQDGSEISFSTELNSSSASLGQLIDEINAAGDGKIKAEIAQDGLSLEITDLTTGSETFAISSPDGDLAQQLGLAGPAIGGVVSGAPLLAGLGDVLLSSLAGGDGLGPLGELAITDRSGASDTVDLSQAKTIGDVIEAINSSSVGVQAQLNRSKTGIEIVDTTGATASDLIIANADATNSADKLQIAATNSDGSISSGSLNKQFIHRNTLLSNWKQGSGLTLGSIKLQDSLGQSATLNLATSKPKTVGDVIDAINALSLGIEAKFNETGDGLLLVDTVEGEGSLSVAEVGNGSVAAQLGIAGTASVIQTATGSVRGINGSQTIRISTTSDMTVKELVDEINTISGTPVNASLLKVGSAGVRLLLNGSHTGAQGRVTVESDVGISFSETSAARDALIAFGATESGGGVLVASSTNTFTGLIDDLQLTIASTSDKAVAVSVTENQDNVTKQIETFVEQYNKLRDRLTSLTVFDQSSNSVGLLFGKSSALRVDLAYGRFLTGQFRGVGSVRSLAQVGVRLNETGKLVFDKSKFEEAMQADPAAVQEFFAKEEEGFAARAKSLADSLAGVDSGALLSRSNSLQSQIELNGKRISSMNVRLDKQRTRLLTQFYNMETAIAKLQTNLTALNQLQIIPAAT
jgi:flagellar hook-associated protein 2